MKEYTAHRLESHFSVKSVGAITLDVPPLLLAATVVEQYQQIKRAGSLYLSGHLAGPF